MRITLDIDDDVLTAARSLARHRGCTLGEMISTLVRSAINAPPRPASSVAELAPLYGFEAFPSEGKIVTNEQIDELRDRAGTAGGLSAGVLGHDREVQLVGIPANPIVEGAHRHRTHVLPQHEGGGEV